MKYKDRKDDLERLGLDPAVFERSEIEVEVRSQAAWVADFIVPEALRDSSPATSYGRYVVMSQCLPRIGESIFYGGYLWRVTGVLHCACRYRSKGQRQLTELLLKFSENQS